MYAAKNSEFHMRACLGEQCRVDNTIKALKKEAEFEVVLKDAEAIKTVLDGSRGNTARRTGGIDSERT